MFTCFFCNKSITSERNIYFGYDAVCCSNICRYEIMKINKDLDPKLNRPDLWYKLPNYAEKKILENTPKRTQSLIDLINNIKVNKN